jgi:sodium-dependent phosphate cotransporter
VHDFFNVASVCLLFPLEAAFKILSRPAAAMGRRLEGSDFFTVNVKDYNIVKKATSPLIDAADGLFAKLMGLSNPVAGFLIAATAVVLLFVALFLLVKALRGLLSERLGGLFGNVLFANPARSYAVGVLTTAMVQSSSVTTSLAVPLVGTGVLKLKQVYPYTLGANLGTTVTALLGALALAANGEPWGLPAAAAHMMFNLCGTAVFWPLQQIPITLAQTYARFASRRRIWVAVFLIGFFFLLPITVILIAAALR